MAEGFDLGAFAYAHRGLWRKAGPPENSLAAFRAAAEAGLGIEFDVRPAADGTPVIFHDYALDRMTDRSDPVERLTRDDLARITLPDGQPIPRLADLFEIWPAHLPLLAELKIDGETDPARFAARVASDISDFGGLAAIMSFSQPAVTAIPPGMMRGQLVLPSHISSEATFDVICRQALSGSADYIAPHVSDAERLRAATPDSFPAVTWTVRTEDDIRSARAAKAAMIFEALDPGLVTGAAMP